MNIGNLTAVESLLFGSTGVVLRSSGVRKDLRLLKSTQYSFYWYLTFKSFLGKRGDSYDRFLIRIREMLESIYIIYQIIPNFLIFFSNSLVDFNFFNFNNLILDNN